jgi:hypothetical protein
MFNFVVKYFGFLKVIPLLPLVFDSQLRLWLLVTNASVLTYIDEIEAEVLSWEGTSAGLHKFGGLQFNFNGKEIGHIHSNGILDILFTRDTKQRLLAEGRINCHHIFTNSGWISFYIRKKEDKDYAIALLRMAWLSVSNKTPLLAYALLPGLNY